MPKNIEQLNICKNKSFKTLDEQISILLERNLKIEDKDFAKSILLKENYYSIINGYRDLFVQNLNTDNEKYIDGTKFEDIYMLYNFDRRLRTILLKNLLKYEASLKTKIAYFFSEKHPEKHSYLSTISYKQDNIHNVIKTINIMSEKINKYKKSIYRGSYKKRNQHPINYYINRYNHVPLWVLINFLTFGNVHYLYINCQDDVQDKIAKAFAKEYKQSYDEVVEIDSGNIYQINKMVNFFRNVCAHEEKLYNYGLYKKVSVKKLETIYRRHKVKFDGKRIFTLLGYLRLVLNKDDYFELIDQIYSEIGKLEFSSIRTGEVVYAMGLPMKWEIILKDI